MIKYTQKKVKSHHGYLYVKRFSYGLKKICRIGLISHKYSVFHEKTKATLCFVKTSETEIRDWLDRGQITELERLVLQGKVGLLKIILKRQQSDARAVVDLGFLCYS